jgi:enoyl-CoA hydratase/carnithine racemase
VLAAEGPAWCSGYHLGALAEGQRTPRPFHEVCDRLEVLRVPTVAAIGGQVHGGGTDLAVSCDLRIGAAGIVLGMPAARIGLQYYPSGLRRFVERIGPDATKRFFLTAETVAAEELLRVGYLHEVVPPERLEGRVDELTAAVAGLAPLAVAGTKAAINALSRGGVDAASLGDGHLTSLRSHDHREALAARRERRPPRFEGR